MFLQYSGLWAHLNTGHIQVADKLIFLNPLCITNNTTLFQIDMTKDALFRGEFEVVKELMAAFPDGDASKRECDKVSYYQFSSYLILFKALFTWAASAELRSQ